MRCVTPSLTANDAVLVRLAYLLGGSLALVPAAIALPDPCLFDSHSSALYSP